jgi:hypothetical protein
MRKLIAALLAILPLNAFAESPALWQDVKEASIVVTGERTIVPAFYRTVRPNKEALTQLLARTPLESTPGARAAAVELTVPKPDGTMARFRIVESPMISAAVAAERPDWKTYEGRGIDDPTAMMRASWSEEGFRAYVLGADGAYFVDPYAKGDRDNHISYFKADAASSRGDFHCGIDKYMEETARPAGTTQRRGSGPLRAAAFSAGANLRTYRLAVATTGEYTVARGGQNGALTEVMNGVNRINLCFAVISRSPSPSFLELTLSSRIPRLIRTTTQARAVSWRSTTPRSATRLATKISTSATSLARRRRHCGYAFSL